MSTKIYLPGLNGLRAIAAFAVIISHIGLALDNFGLEKHKGYDLANFGVTIFFTLSGFLITYLLLAEKKNKKRIDIKKFYIRRILRIWPLYFLYLLVVLLFIDFQINNGIYYYLFIMPNVLFALNIITNNSMFIPYLNHYWSLGVEEQFYAFWPLAMQKVKNVIAYFMIFIIGFFVLKLFVSLFKVSEFLNIFLHYTRFGCMAMGGFAAYLLFNNHPIVLFFNKKIIEILAWLLLCVVALNRFHLFSIIDHEIIAMVTIVIILNQVNNNNRLISLENRLFDYLGKISFGLYVYNPLIIAVLAKYGSSYLDFESIILKLIVVYTLLIFSIILISHISYFYFESTFLKIKNKFTVIKSASSKY